MTELIRRRSIRLERNHAHNRRLLAAHEATRIGIITKRLAFALIVLLTIPCFAEELPVEIQADLLMFQAERHIKERNFDAAKATLDKALALRTKHGITVPPAMWFSYAQVAYHLETYAEAAKAATWYLTEAGQGAESYRQALELLDAAEHAQRQQEAEAARLRSVREAERLAREATQQRLNDQWQAERELAATMANSAAPLARDSLQSGCVGPEMVAVPAGAFCWASELFPDAGVRPPGTCAEPCRY